MLAGAHHLLALAEMHLGRRGEDHGVGALDAFRQIPSVVRDAVFLRDLGGGVLIPAYERGHFHAVDTLQRVEMFLAEGTLPGDANFHHLLLRTSVLRRAAARLVLDLAFDAAFDPVLDFPTAFLRFSRMMWPTAVFDAGTV